jgi:hypothetical protein
MKRIVFVAAAGLAALVSACATPPEGSQVASNVSADGEQLVCRSMKVTGTRFAERECKTAEAWKQYDAYTNENAKEATDKIQRVNSGAATNAGG